MNSVKAQVHDRFSNRIQDYCKENIQHHLWNIGFNHIYIHCWNSVWIQILTPICNQIDGETNG